MIGITISLKLKKRLHFLDDVTYMLSAFSGSISYYRQPLSEMISDFNKNENEIEFIKSCTVMLDSDVDFPEAWTTSVEEHCPYLTKEEKIKLIEYGKCIGKTDTEGQKVILDTYYGYFEKYKSKANDDFNKYNRTVIASFFFLGCGIFILLI